MLWSGFSIVNLSRENFIILLGCLFMNICFIMKILFLCMYLYIFPPQSYFCSWNRNYFLNRYSPHKGWLQNILFSIFSVWHQNTNLEKSSLLSYLNFLQILWTFSIYLESVAILPQLFMISKTGEAETITSHYLFALGAYRALYIVNWIYRYYFEGFYDFIAIVAGCVQTALYCDFFYLYITKGVEKLICS